MGGVGALSKLRFGRPYMDVVSSGGARMRVDGLFGGMTATSWVQIIKDCLMIAGATFMAVAVLAQFHFSPEALFAKAWRGYVIGGMCQVQR